MVGARKVCNFSASACHVYEFMEMRIVALKGNNEIRIYCFRFFIIAKI